MPWRPVPPGSMYCYRLNGHRNDPIRRPLAAARRAWPPSGGPTFAWDDGAWHGPWSHYVLYELHVGIHAGGTFDALSPSRHLRAGCSMTDARRAVSRAAELGL